MLVSVAIVTLGVTIDIAISLYFNAELFLRLKEKTLNQV